MEASNEFYITVKGRQGCVWEGVEFSEQELSSQESKRQAYPIDTQSLQMLKFKVTLF